MRSSDAEYRKEFQHKLRKRDIKHELKSYVNFQNYICQLRLSVSQKNINPDFTSSELKVVVKQFKNGKCMDPIGHVKEIFKYSGDSFLIYLCYRYIDDLIVFNNKKFLDYLKEIYPSQLTVEKANKSDHLADYLDLTFIIDSGGKLSTRLYDKRDDFDFHIVNFPFLSSNIPSGPSYGVYISQLIRYARCCSHYDDFRYRYKCLVDRLLSQGYKALRLEKSFKKFYGRYQDLIEKYRRSVNAMVSDSFPGQFLFNM